MAAHPASSRGVLFMHSASKSRASHKERAHSHSPFSPLILSFRAVNLGEESAFGFQFWQFWSRLAGAILAIFAVVILLPCLCILAPLAGPILHGSRPFSLTSSRKRNFWNFIPRN